MKRIVLLAGVCVAVSVFAFDFFGLFGSKKIDLLDKERRVVAIATTNEWSSSRLAADELTNYVSKVTGVTLKVERWKGGEVEKCEGTVKKSTAPLHRSTTSPLHHATVVIGTVADLGNNVPAEARKALEATDNDEASWTGVRDGILWIVGKDEVAELYATYHFIEKHLGVRWFKAPTKDDPGEYVPDLRKVEKWSSGEVEWCGGKLLLPDDYAEFREPRFVVRRLDDSGVWGGENWIGKAGAACAVRNGMQIGPAYGARVSYEDPDSKSCRFYGPRVQRRSASVAGGGHLTFTESVRGDVYKKPHPEYFPMIKGKRICNAQYCLSNTNLAPIVADYVLKKIDAAGGQGRFLFGQVDSSNGACECPECVALDPGRTYAGGSPCLSQGFFRTVQAAAKLVWEKRPDAQLRAWAYDTYRKYPEGQEIDPRLQMTFCTHGRCYAHAFDDPDCPLNGSIYRELRTWLSHTRINDVYEYFSCSDPLYVCHEAVEAHDIRLLDSLGIRGWKNEWSFTGSRYSPNLKPDDVRPDINFTNWQWLYLTSKLLWDPSLDPQAVLDDAEAKYYGPAYPAMKKYHALRRRLWETTPGCMGYPRPDNRRPALLETPGAQEKLLALLDEAEKFAKGDLIKYRVEKDRAWLNRYWIKRHDNFKRDGNVDLAIRPPRRSGSVVIDGRDDEIAWWGAATLDLTGDGTTRFDFMHDDEALYVRVRAKDSDGMKKGDGVALSFRPPVAATNLWTCSFVWDGESVKVERWRGGEVERCCGGVVERCEAVGRSAPDRRGWTMEIRLPLSAIHSLKRGDIWLAGCARLCGAKTTGDDLSDPKKFRAMIFGRTELPNAACTLRRADKPGKSEPWEASPKSALLSSGGYQTPGGYSKMLEWGLVANPKANGYTWSVLASGEGELSVSRIHYDGSPAGKGKIIGVVTDAKVKLDGTLRLYTGHVDIPPFERTIMMMSTSKPGVIKWVKLDMDK